MDAQDKEERRLKAEIAKVDRLIEPLKAQRDVLYRQLSELQQERALQAHGFTKDEPLAYTDSLEREFHERHWSAWDINSFRDADVIRLGGLDTSHGAVLGAITTVGSGTGNVPLSVLRDMQAAYRQQHPAKEE